MIRVHWTYVEPLSLEDAAVSAGNNTITPTTSTSETYQPSQLNPSVLYHVFFVLRLHYFKAQELRKVSHSSSEVKRHKGKFKGQETEASLKKTISQNHVYLYRARRL